MMLAAIRVACQMFTPVFDPAHRTFEPHRQISKADLFAEQDALVAKSTADIGRDDADHALIDAETFGKTVSDDVRHLRRGIDHDLLRLIVPIGHHAAAFDGRHALPCGAQRSLEFDSRVLCGRLEIDVDECFKENVLRPMSVYERRTGIAGARHVDDGRQFFEIERDELGEILGLRTSVGDTGSKRLANMTHLVARQHWLHRATKTRQP